MYEALANHVAKVSRKMYEAPEFFYYAIADGLRWLFVCHGRWRGLDCVREKHGDLQMESELLSGWWHVIRVASNGKIDENRARPREGSVAVSKPG